MMSRSQKTAEYKRSHWNVSRPLWSRLGVSITIAASFAGYLLLVGWGKSESPASASGTSVSKSAKPYTVGTVIEFQSGGTAAMYEVSGWSHPEETFTWTEGTSATLVIGTQPKAGPLKLRLRAAGLINPPDLPHQPVEVYANGQKIADWQVADTADFEAKVPGSATDAGGLAIELKIPKATTPKVLGKGDDSRVLGICCFSLVFLKAD